MSSIVCNHVEQREKRGKEREKNGLLGRIEAIFEWNLLLLVSFNDLEEVSKCPLGIKEI